MHITVKRYADPESFGWAGYLQPEDLSWIAFIGRDGRPVFFLNRDAATGIVLPDEPEEQDRARAQLRFEERRAASWEVGQAHDEEPPPIAYARAIVESGRYVGKADAYGPVPPVS